MHSTGNSARIADAGVLPLLILLFLPALPALAQTTWFKYTGNPILDVGPKGSWDDRVAIAHRVVRTRTGFAMWYGGIHHNQAGMGYATSRDGVRWSKHQSNPIVEPRTGEWDSVKAYYGYVLAADSLMHMWYTGGPGVRVRIGHSSSADGVNWQRADKPVMNWEPLEFWRAGGCAAPSVLGPDADGTLHMWYHGIPASGWGIQIGYASGKGPRSWTSHPAPVLARGPRGSWDDQRVGYPRVLHDGAMYRMWYSGSRELNSSFRVGGATSADGISWTKCTGNPVVDAGPPGSWDGAGTWTGDVMFDGRLYHMWYVGDDNTAGRTGYAVSPKGIQVSFSPSGRFVRKGDPVRIAVTVAEPQGLAFSARIMNIPRGRYFPGLIAQADLREVVTFALHDDGMHDDGAEEDGVFANSWAPGEENVFLTDLHLRLGRGSDTLGFVLAGAGGVTTVGPIRFSGAHVIEPDPPRPGDTIVVKISLRNEGALETPAGISAALAAEDSMITDVSAVSTGFGVIGAGATASGYYRFRIDPGCPPDSDVRLRLDISTLGIDLWKDTFLLHISPPWWRTIWAYGLLVLAAVTVLLSLRWIEMRRLRARHQREMEKFQLEQLKEVDRLKSRFFANISHEFRTPLTLIQGPAEQISSGDPTADHEDLARLIVRNSRRLLRLVDQLLNLSRIEAGHRRLKPDKSDIALAIRECAASFESLAVRKSIRFMTAGLDRSIVGWFDRDALEQIITNLLSNAFKFTDTGGSVRLELLSSDSAESTGPPRPAGAAQDSVCVVVTDTGIGIPADKLERIFERFYQVEEHQARGFEGTGIGLSLTRELVNLHGGNISVRSEPGKGTSFTVTLPIGEATLANTTVLSETEEPPDGRGLTPEPATPGVAVASPGDQALPVLLVVEDNDDLRTYIRSQLAAAYVVREAGTGEMGLEDAVASIPDIIISDIMMPGMDGIELCKRLKEDERTSHIPVILLTAKAGTDNKLEGLETGADDYLVKPFDAAELKARIRNLIDNRRRVQERFRHQTIDIRPGRVVAPSMDEVFLGKVLAIVERHIADEDFDVVQLAEVMSMSYTQLYRKLRALTGLSGTRFIRQFRLHRAMDLLRQNSGTVAEIAYSVGFGSPPYFTRCFREEFGILPSEAARQGNTPG